MISTALVVTLLAQAPAHPWPHAASEPLATAIPAPAGFRRLPEDGKSFGQWLRTLPVKPVGTPVRIFNGALKGNQAAHVRVIDMDVGKKNHQQCADAVMRLRAEYLYSRGADAAICFRATNGAPLAWTDWKAGLRPTVAGRKITWKVASAAGGDWATFRRYLDFVFVYAGTYSLEKELVPVPPDDPLQAGDIVIQGGFPGHAVMVIDVAEDEGLARRFLLAQSYMPAQDIHVLAGPTGASPWYPFPVPATLKTPEWTFSPARRMRFRDNGGCPTTSPRR